MQIKGWAREGLTDKQIAENMGVAERTFTDWKARFPAILAALKEGKAPVDFEVENSLLKSALGFYVTIREPFKLREEIQKQGEGKIIKERIEYAEKQVYIPPQTVAQIFWLKNRKPDRWKDKREQVVSTKDGVLADLISGLREPEGEQS